MFSLRQSSSALLALSLIAAAPQPAVGQYYYQAPDISAPPVTGAEPQLGLGLPGATTDELRAGLVWHLRVAMNVAALQCDFEPTLLTVSNYNATLAHHKAELTDSFARLGTYFKRTAGSAAAGQRALDMYNTRIYSSYSTVHAQREFCGAMGRIGREAIFAPRGGLTAVAQRYLGQIRRALTPAGDQYFTNPAYGYHATLPSFGKKCWKKDRLRDQCADAWNKAVANASR